MIYMMVMGWQYMRGRKFQSAANLLYRRLRSATRKKNRRGGASGAAEKKHPDIRAFNKLFLSQSDE